MNRRNVLIVLGMIILGAAVVAANLWYKKETGLAVTTEVIKARDLEAVVSASGKIQPKSLVNISAETPGRVVELEVVTDAGRIQPFVPAPSFVLRTTRGRGPAGSRFVARMKRSAIREIRK